MLRFVNSRLEVHQDLIDKALLHSFEEMRKVFECVPEDELNNFGLTFRRELTPKTVLVGQTHVVIVVAVLVSTDQLLVQNRA